MLGTERAILDRLEVAVVLTDVAGRVIHWNPHAELLYGWKAEQAVGRDAAELLLPGMPPGAHADLAATLRATGTWSGELAATRRDGTRIDVFVSTALLRDEGGSPTGLVSVSFDLTARKRAEQRLALQYGVTQALAEAETLDEAAPRVLEAVCATTGWEVGALWTPDDDGDSLRCVQAWLADDGRHGSFVETSRATRLSSGIGLPGRVWASGRPAWIPDVVRDRNFPRAPSAASVGLHSGVAFPVVLGDELLGVIEFFSEEIREPDDELLRMMAGTGGQVGQFIERKEAERAVRESEARASAILGAALDCIITVDDDGRVVEWNPAAERTFGYARNEAIGRDIAGLIVPPDLRPAHRSGLIRYRETGQASILGSRREMTAMRADGTTFPVELTVTSADLTGPRLFIGYLRDITERKRAEAELARVLAAEQRTRLQVEKAQQRLAFLAEAGTLLASTLDFRAALESLARLAVTLLADICLMDILDDRGELQRMVAVHADPRREQLTRQLQGRYPPKRGGPHPAARVVETGRPQFSPEMSDEFLRATTRDEEHYRITKELGMQSYICVPLVARERILGTITLVSTDPARRFGPGDVTIAEELAGRTALTVDNARLFEAEQRTAQRLAFLAEASAALTADVLDYEATLANVARLAVPTLADWCTVDLIEDGGVVERVAVAHIDAAKEPLVREFVLPQPPTPHADPGVSSVLRTGQPEIYPEISEELFLVGEGDAAAYRALRPRSAIVAPLVARRRTLGALTLVFAESGRRYERDELLLAKDLARRAALAVDNARLHRDLREVARTLQQSLLPPGLPSVAGLELGHVYRAAEGDNKIGGDFYDVFETPDQGWALVIGDVCGKGVKAAAVTGLVRHTVRAVAMRERRPSAILRMLNEALLHQAPDDRFCTVCYVALRPGPSGASVTVCSGGHPLPLILRATGAVEVAGAPGTLLGPFAAPSLEDVETTLFPGDAIVLYTDGVIEERGSGLLAGEERLLADLRSASGMTADGIATRMGEAVQTVRPEASRDDVAILVARVAPLSESRARSRDAIGPATGQRQTAKRTWRTSPSRTT